MDVETKWTWPFSMADLTAGLRRSFGDATIAVKSVKGISLPHMRPAIGRLRGLRVHHEGKTGRRSSEFVVKEPIGTTRTGLAGAGRKEVGVYRSLVDQLPLKTPGLIAASESGDWLILEALRPTRNAEDWTRGDYLEAIEALAHLHDRFWGLASDLSAYPWLGHPLGADFEVHVTVAAQAMEKIVKSGQPVPLARLTERMEELALLIKKAVEVVRPLREQPGTLLHGDYWPGNIEVVEDGTQVVYDWQMASVGPCILDLLVLASKSEWLFGELPISREDMLDEYRAKLRGLTGQTWNEREWSELWDHALMWRFLQDWMDLLAASPDKLLESMVKQLEQVWLEPVSEAVKRRL